MHLQALKDEVVEYFMTGTISPSPSGSSGGGSSDGWAVNPTLLQPGSGRWLLHYGALPFLGFVPLDPAKHADIAAASGLRALTEVGWARELAFVDLLQG